MAARKLKDWKAFLPEFALRGVPVLLYHGIRRQSAPTVPGREAKYWVSEDQFCEQLEWISSNNFSVLLLRDLWSTTAQPGAHSKAVVLTFDDGLVSNARIAAPLLRVFGYRAEFFLSTSFVGRNGHVSWDQVEAMHRDGMSFQSHGTSHVALTYLDPARLRAELVESRPLVHVCHQEPARLDSAAEFLSAPYGRFNSRVLDASLSAGYRGICTSWSWPAGFASTVISRIVIYQHTGIRQFARLVQGNSWSHLARAARSAFLSIPKALLPGERAYVSSGWASEEASK